MSEAVELLEASRTRFLVEILRHNDRLSALSEQDQDTYQAPTRDAFDRPRSPLGELMKALAVVVPSREIELPLFASHEWITAEVEIERGCE